MDNEEISLAQTLYNVTDSNVLEIGTGKNAVPDASGALSAVTVAPTGENNRGNTMPYVSGYVTRTTSGSNPTPTADSASAGLSPSFLLFATAVACYIWLICIVL